MRSFLQDMRFALRMFRKNPGFTAVAVLTLALGIGANTAIFSAVHAVLLKPLPYPEAQQLVSLSVRSYPKFSLVCEQTHTMSSVAGYYSFSSSLATRGEPETIKSAHASREFFGLLGTMPALGRIIAAEEEVTGGANVAILSDAFWHSHFAASGDVLGKTLVLDGISTTIIGVLPPSFHFPFEFPEPDVWLPRVFEHPLLKLSQVQVGAGYLSVIGRLRPQTALPQAQAELGTLDERYRREFPNFVDAPKNHQSKATLLSESLVAGIRTSLLALVAAVGFVLLIACANVANLLLARATSREKEIALRKALGASRGRLVRQLLSESALLSALGGLLGVSLAFAWMPVFRSIGQRSFPRIAEVGLDAPVLLFSVLLSLVTAVLFGLAPAMQTAGRQLHESLKEGVRGSTVGGARGRFRSALVVAEIAVALILMTGAGLLVESFARLMQVSLGFSPHGVTTFPLTLPASRYAQADRQIQFYRDLLERVRSGPAVQHAGLVSFLPLAGGYRLSYFCMEGQVCLGLGKDPLIAFWQISPGYLESMGTPLMRGRLFDERDIAGGAPVTIVNETLVNHYWPNQNPLGKHIAGSRDLVQREVIGVVADTKFSSLNAVGADQLYVPLEQMPYTTMTLVVRSATPSEALVTAVRAKITEVDPALPVSGVVNMDSVVAESASQPRLITQFVAAFAGFALMLSAIGIYGVMAYSVSARRQEMGIRMSLGASPGDILKLVVGQGMRLALIGVSIGMLASLVLTRLIATLLFGVRSTDPLAFTASAGALLITALLACYFPARRATQVDPIIVLRSE